MMFSLRRLHAVTRKEFIQVLRDPRSLVLSLLIPVLLLLLFGYALTLDVSEVPTIVWDQSRTPQSRELIGLLDGSPYFTLTEYTAGYEQILGQLASGKVLMALVVPSDFAQKLAQGRDAPVQVLLDGSDSNTAQYAIGYAQNVGMLYSRQVAMEQVWRGQATRQQEPVRLESRAWFNPDLVSKNYIVPGLLVFIMAVIAAMLASLTVAREWERGTMEQLIATPVRAPEVIIGKLIPYWIIGMLDVAGIMLLGRYVFHVPMRGNPLWVLVIGGVFLIGILSQGVMLSIVTRSQVLASQLAIISSFLPSLILSGFVFSISNMPRVLQVISYIVPARYAIELMRAVYLKGITPAVLWLPMLLLCIYATLMFINANHRFRKKLA